MNDNMITCGDCGTIVPRTGPTQLYCTACSERRDLLRKRLWARTHRPGPGQRRRHAEMAVPRTATAREAGRVANATATAAYQQSAETSPLLWSIRVSIPFSYAASKNAIYRMLPHGHVFLRREARAHRDAIALRVRQSLAGRRIAHNKVWLDILVQKPNHKGDAVNVVDTVCDAVKRAVPVDDRWFCIRRLDWQIVKDNPQLIIGLGQDSDVDCQVCSYCGQIKPFSEFGRRRHSHLGIGRECRDCRRSGDALGKHHLAVSEPPEMRAAAAPEPARAITGGGPA